jgi:hypothetical protein
VRNLGRSKEMEKNQFAEERKASMGERLVADKERILIGQTL